MLGGNNGNPILPMFIDEDRVAYQSNASNQLKLFVPLESNKRGREMEEQQQQKRTAVSTGLRLSCDDDERNSTVTSGSGSLTGAPRWSAAGAGETVRAELERQREEFEGFMKAQEEEVARGLREMKQRHVRSLVAAVGERVREKEAQVESLHARNRELLERIKHAACEAHAWQCRAKYNEYLVNHLSSDLQRAKEGFGDSDLDNAASSSSSSFSARHLALCRACRSTEVSMLLMPCRHLSLCKHCDAFLAACPVCRSVKTASFQVHLS